MAEESSSHPLSCLELPLAAVASFVSLIPFLTSKRLSAHEENRDLLESLRLVSLPDVPNTLAHRSLAGAPASSLQSISQLACVQQLFSQPRRFRDMTMLTITEFFLLHSQLAEAIASSRPMREEEPAHSHPMPTKLNTVEQLLMWLVYMESVDVKPLTWVFGLLPINTFYRYVDHVTASVNNALEHMLRWPTAEERRCLYGYFSIHDKAVAVLDGTHCKIEEPHDDARSYWNGYKHKDTQNYLCYVNVFGIILRVEGPFPGRPNDRADWNRSDIKHHPERFLSEGERILADGGFIGGRPLLVPIVKTVMDKERNEERKEKMEEVNQEFSDNRALVEDVFGWLKAKAKRLAFRYARAKERQSNEFFAACRVFNSVRWKRIQHAAQQPAS